MQLHHLTFEAIGPFADSYSIDFDALGAQGLFLLTGPTGSGKSTILDAVVFALYGASTTAADSATNERLHCASAPQKTPFVELTFSTHAGVYRIYRTPEHYAPKQRGEGVTKRNSTCVLTKLDSPEEAHNRDAGEVITDRVREAGVEIGRIIGLKRTEFTQTMVLPQGQFAQFLQAPAEERTDILRELFGTEIYTRLQHQLEQHARNAEKSVEAAAKKTAQMLHVAFSAATRSDLPTPPPSWLRLTPTPLPALDETRTDSELIADETAWLALGRAEEEFAAIKAAAQTAHERATNQLEALQAEREALAAQAERQRRGAKARETQAELAKTAPETTQQRALIALQTALRTAANAAGELTAETSALTAALQRLDGDIQLPPEGANADTLAAWWQQCDIETVVATAQAAARRAVNTAVRNEAEFDHLEKLQRDHDEYKTRADKLCDKRKTLGKDLRAARREKTRLPETIAALSAKLTGEQAVAKGLAAAEQALEQARSAQQAVSELAAIKQRAEDAAALLTKRSEAHTRAAANYQQLTDAWAAHAAARLASQLADSEPCPVCGATNHPAPATASERLVELSDVEEANQQAGAALQALTAAKADADTLREQVDAQSRELGELDETGANAAVEKAQADVVAASAAVKQVAALENRLAQAETNLAVATSNAHHLAKQISHSTAELRAARAKQREASAAVTKQLGEYPSVAAYRDAVAKKRTAADTQLDAASAAARRKDACERAVARYQRAVADVGDDPQLATAAPDLTAPLGATDIAALVLTEEKQQALSKRLADVDARAAAAAETLADPQVQATLAAPVANVESLAGPLAAARASVETITAQLATAKEASRQLARRHDEAKCALQHYRERSERVADELLLGRLARGENPQRLTLATYVLIDMFDDVLAATNARLIEISEGRYELQRRLELEKARQRRLGLALHVWDHAHGKKRSIASLSGGETFYTALCLALGLADCVRAAHGGIEMNTLFIDEGFGSLDSETLQAVMERLYELQRAGRLVGVVSHVEEMRNHIATQIMVQRSDRGISTLSVTDC